MESRIHGDMYVRFGGRLVETYHRKVEKRCWPSLLKSNHITFIGRAIRKIRWIMSGRKSWLEQTELIEMNIKIDKLLREKIIE